MSIKKSHGTVDNDGLSYNNLCVHLDVDLPEGYKILKFKTFGSIGNLMAHLRRYYDKMVKIKRSKALLMHLFSQSLSGKALDWKALAKDFLNRFAYSFELVPNRHSPDKIK